MSNYRINEIRGVIPALITTFDQNEKLDLTAARVLTHHLCAQDFGGLYLTGSTGEGFLMSNEERKIYVETVIDEVKGRIPIIVHVGAISTLASEDLARHAASVGADAISSVPPIYWKFNDQEITGYYNSLVQAAGLPMIVYNIALAGLVSFEMIKQLGEIDGVEGIKYTSSTLFDVFRIKEALGDNFMVYSGSDELAISGLAFGSDGLIGSTYNVLGSLFIKIWKEMENNDVTSARETQRLANRFLFTLLNNNLMPAIKETLNMAGIPARRSRRPFTNLNEQQKKALRDDYANLKKEIGDCGLDFMKGL